MHRRSASLLLPASALVIALGLATGASFAADAPSTGVADTQRQMQVAEKDPVPGNDVEDPSKLYKVTPNEISECMKAWDPQTQMSKAEFEASCRSSLKYYPENP